MSAPNLSASEDIDYTRANCQQMHDQCLKSYARIAPYPEDLIDVPVAGRESHAPVSPLTGLPTPAVPKGTAADVQRLIKVARAAQERWGKTPLVERSKLLLRMHDAMWRYRDELLDIIQWESGKSRVHAFDEIQDFAITARYYARTLVKVLSPKTRRGAIPGLTFTIEAYQPKGVVGIISPWNYPLSLAVGDAIAAIAAGNAVILKPDSHSPHTAIAIKKILIDAGLNPDLFQIITGSGAEIGTPLIDVVDYMMFTGSSATGRTIAAQCGQRLIGCSAELGGKNPMLIMGDVDIKKAVDGAIRACFTCAGQLCISIERLYVQSSIYDEFLEAFLEAVNNLSVEPSLDWGVDVGVLISPEHLAKVDSHVADARAKGARILAGGHALPERGATAYAPTVLTGVTEEMTVCREETFGPVVSVYRFDTPEEGVRLANDTNYGLNASIYTRSRSWGRFLAMQIHAGTVNINEAFAAAWGSIDAPMGGMKDSGLGRRHGAAGLTKYTEPQNISSQMLIPLAPPAPKWNQAWAEGMSLALRALRYLRFK